MNQNYQTSRPQNTQRNQNNHWQNQSNQRNQNNHWQNQSNPRNQNNNWQNQNIQDQALTLSPKLKTVLADFAKFRELDITPEGIWEVLTQTCFKQNVSDAQMIALLLVAKKYNLDPFTGEIYAFPTKNGGIVPIVGVNGWSNLVNSHPQCDGIEFKASEETFCITNQAGTKINVHNWIECILSRKDRKNPVIVREYLSETYKPSITKDDGYVVEGPWQSHPNRMLRHKALIQCARYAFSFTGIYDQDEGLDTVRFEDARFEQTPTVDKNSPEQNTQSENQADQVQDHVQQEEVNDPEKYTSNFKQDTPPETVIDNRRPLDQKRFENQLTKIKQLIDEGSTVEEGINKIMSSYALTQDQLQQIKDIQAR